MTKKILTEITEDELSEIIILAVEKAINGKSNIPLNPQYLSRKDAAKRLQISEVTLSKYTKEGKITSYSLGGKVKYIESDLDAAIVMNHP